MSTADDTLRLDQLLTQGAWLRRMARGLLHDEALAEDAVQQTLVTALERPPRREGNLKGWFGTVLINKIRGEARRQKVAAAGQRKAEAAAIPGVVLTGAPSPEETVSNLQLQRLVATLLLELDPPVRQVVYLRYFEELDSVEIGRRLGEAAGTVRWRLKVGIEELRRGLDRQDIGEGKQAGNWRRALLPLVPVPAVAPKGALPGGASSVGSAAAGRWTAAAFPWLGGALGAAAVMGAASYLLASRHGSSRPPGATQMAMAATDDGARAGRRRPPALRAAAAEDPGTPPGAPATAPPGPGGRPMAARRTAPFAGVVWAGDRPSVRLGDEMVDLLGIDGVAIDAVVGYAKRTFPESPSLWQKRIAEDLVEVLTGMGRPPTDPLPLQIRRAGGQTETVQAPMTAENRRSTWEARAPARAPAPELVDRFARVSPFSGMVFEGDSIQVEVQGAWYRLVAIDGATVPQLVQASRNAFGSRWQKRIAEDTVEVLTAALGRTPGAAVDLVLEQPGSGQRLERPAVPMTEENRKQVKSTWR
jgi:RNA polymerase sigma-70 factor (ECF subfamily)